MIIEFSTDGSAFEVMPSIETSRILREIAWLIQNGATAGSIRDGNGNNVGNWSMDPEAGKE